MKVVIPRTACRDKKMVFSTPRGQYECYDQTIGGEKTSDDPFQVSNNEFDGGYTCGQHELTKVAKVGKNSHNFEVQKIAVIQAKSVFYRKSSIFSKLESEDAKLCWWIEQP